LLRGRVAMNGVTPYESLTPALALLTIAAAKAAMNGGVNSTMNSIRKTSAGVSLTADSKASSNGRRSPTIAGSDRPYRRHSSHV